MSRGSAACTQRHVCCSRPVERKFQNRWRIGAVWRQPTEFTSLKKHRTYSEQIKAFRAELDINQRLSMVFACERNLRTAGGNSGGGFAKGPAVSRVATPETRERQPCARPGGLLAPPIRPHAEPWSWGGRARRPHRTPKAPLYQPPCPAQPRRPWPSRKRSTGSPPRECRRSGTPQQSAHADQGLRWGRCFWPTQALPL